MKKYIIGFVFIAVALVVFAATTPNLLTTDSFAILSSTYTDTSGGTTVNGDVGYTTPPATPPTINGITHIADGEYNQAGTDQANVLSSLNSQPCDFNFGSATDLSLLPQPLTEGVYCVIGAMSVGTGGITINSGTYIFRSTGALNTVANSVVSGNSCDIFWTPVATTLGANSTFKGTVIDDAGITVGSTVNWEGRALAFGGTVTTDADIITVPSCSNEEEDTPPIRTPNRSSGSYIHYGCKDTNALNYEYFVAHKPSLCQYAEIPVVVPVVVPLFPKTGYAPK